MSLSGGTPVLIDTYPDFSLDIDRVRQSITPRTKAILLNSPANPTGRVASRREVQRPGLAGMQQHGLLLISDEIYRVFCYEPGPSPAEFNEHVLVVDGFSKSHGMTGWRLGFAHGPKRLIEEMNKLQQFTFVCAPSMVQHAGVVACDVDMSGRVDEYRKKRDLVFEGLRDKYDLERAGGAFYLFPRAPRGNATIFVQEAIARELLVIPGCVFSRCDTHFRLSYAADAKTLRCRGVEILRTSWPERLRKKCGGRTPGLPDPWQTGRGLPPHVFSRAREVVNEWAQAVHFAHQPRESFTAISSRRIFSSTATEIPSLTDFGANSLRAATTFGSSSRPGEKPPVEAIPRTSPLFVRYTRDLRPQREPRHIPKSAMSENLVRLGTHLYRFTDTCNVYLLVDGEAGLLIDSGSGDVLDHLHHSGVRQIEWVLHTHHHRDQCWGASRVRAHGAKVAVPEYERHLFDQAEVFWQNRRTFDNYNDRNTFFSIGENIPVDATLYDYETFSWRGYRFFVLPAKGHTLGSSALIVEVDGQRLAFTGDLFAASGKLYQLHAMEYTYGCNGRRPVHASVDPARSEPARPGRVSAVAR